MWHIRMAIDSLVNPMLASSARSIIASGVSPSKT